MISYGFDEVATRDRQGIRDWVRFATREPIAALYVMKVLAMTVGDDEPSARPMPSGGCAAFLARVGVIDWTQGLLGGHKALREEARQLLETLPADCFVAAEDWGMRGCPGLCRCCCLIDFCVPLKVGLL